MKLKNYNEKRLNSGFTLIEVIIVILIIGIIAAIVMVALEESRQKSRNVARVTQIQEYQKAFNLYYSQTGYYPRNGSVAQSQICLGDYTDNRCWSTNNVTPERPNVWSESIIPQYMARIPAGEDRLFGQGGNGGTFKGMIYIHQDYGKAYTVRWFMEGNNRSCILAGATGNNTGDDTLCSLSVTP